MSESYISQFVEQIKYHADPEWASGPIPDARFRSNDDFDAFAAVTMTASGAHEHLG